VRPARRYPDLGLTDGLPLYAHLKENPDALQWVPFPGNCRELWPKFEP
jgi:hypothetical protein